MNRFAAITAAASMTAAAMTAAPALAQDDADMAEADRAAETMMTEVYVYDTTPYKTPSEIIANLRNRGYTDIDDFDVEWGYYEVEAIPPGGDDDVELEIDPITGAILDIEDNWF
ncbi:hypothetical protein [Caenispirillum salinarum]|uniref:hypothetical protein n=1 Tax=Caenispirillum salinarum TaxID=859058 RepID=UPI00384D346B